MASQACRACPAHPALLETKVLLVLLVRPAPGVPPALSVPLAKTAPMESQDPSGPPVPADVQAKLALLVLLEIPDPLALQDPPAPASTCPPLLA